MNSANITLHIDRIVLEGIPLSAHQRHLLKTSLETHLTELLAQSGLSQQFSQGLAVPRLVATDFQLNVSDLHRPSGIANLSRQIASSVHGGLHNA